MQQQGIGPGRGSSNLATNHLALPSSEVHPENATKAFHPFQQLGLGSRSDAGWNAPHQQPPNQQMTKIHQQTGDLPDTLSHMHLPSAPQSYATVNRYDAANSAMPGFPYHGTAQSGHSTCQHVNTLICSCYTNGGAMPTESDRYSHFDEAISSLPSQKSSSGGPQEQVSHHNNTASERPAMPRPPEPAGLKIHGELNSHPLPWSSENQRGGEDPARAVMSQLLGMQRWDLDPIQLDAADNVFPFIGPHQGQLPLVQDVNQNVTTFSQGYQEAGVQDEGGQMGGHTEDPNDPRTPRHPQPGQLAADSANIQDEDADLAAQSVGDPSIPDTSTTSTSTQSHKCPNCDKRFRGRYWKGNCARHIRQAHNKSGTQKLECKVVGCGRLYARNDARLKHYRKHHQDQDYILLGIDPP